MFNCRIAALSSAALILVGSAVYAQDDESTIRAIPDPYADLPAAVTDSVPFPTEANAQGANNSESGRSGARRDAGLETARDAFPDDVSVDAADQAADGLATAQEHAAEAAQEALANAAEAAAANRADFGRSHAPDGLPDQVPDTVPDVPNTVDLPDSVPPDLPGGPPDNLPTPQA